MAQRRRAGHPITNESHETTAQGTQHRPSPLSTSPEAHLHPAPQHPLFPVNSNSPSKPSFAAAGPASAAYEAQLQRRRRGGASSSTADEASRREGDEEWRDKYAKDGERPTTTLDRLEGWFGIGKDTRGPTAQASNRAPPHSSASLPSLRNRSAPRLTVSKSSRLVLVHVVLPADSLEGLALRYNTDVRTLRRANGLWPGDSVLARKEIYIPVNEEAAQGQHPGAVKEASEEADGKLSLLQGTFSRPSLHTRSLSGTSISSSGATSISHAQSASATMLDSTPNSAADGKSLSPPELRRIPATALSHFPPPGSSPATTAKGKEKEQEYEYGMGLKSSDELLPGESGVEDLLTLAERARLRGSSEDQRTESQPTMSSSDEAQNVGQPVESATTPTSANPPAIEEEWKPNKYTLGQRSRRPPSNLSASANEDTEQPSSSPASNGLSDPKAPASYNGWNDIPEPPLSRTAKGQVAHAYKANKRRYPRPGGVGVEVPGGGIMEDLAAGLPPNPGPAANWARPIGDSLPLSPSAEEAAKRAGQKHPGSSKPANSLGWGQILADTVRGKMRLEEALERGYEDIRAGISGRAASGTGPGASTASGASLPPPPSDRMLRGESRETASRPSAEMARAALSESGPRRTGTRGEAAFGNAKTEESGASATRNGAGAGLAASNGSLHVDNGSGTMPRRSSGRSLHELEDLRVEHMADGQGESANQQHNYQTWSASSGVGPTKAQPRRAVRDLDWLE